MCSSSMITEVVDERLDGCKEVNVAARIGGRLLNSSIDAIDDLDLIERP